MLKLKSLLKENLYFKKNVTHDSRQHRKSENRSIFQKSSPLEAFHFSLNLLYDKEYKYAKSKSNNKIKKNGSLF